MTIKAPGRTSRQRIVGVRSTGRNLELSLACGHTVIRAPWKGYGEFHAYCGHCAAEWADNMRRLIGGA